jgi:hypothetical protein
VAVGEPEETPSVGVIPGFVQTEDFSFTVSPGALRLDEAGHLRQVLDDGRTVPVVSPDIELRGLQVFPDKGWLLISPVRPQRDSFGRLSSMLLIDPAHSRAQGVVSAGHELLPPGNPLGEPVGLGRDGSLNFRLRDELSGGVRTARWRDDEGLKLSVSPKRSVDLQNQPRSRLARLDFDTRPLDAAQTSGIWTFCWDSAATPPGPVTLTVRACDAAGAAGEASVGVKLAQVTLSLTGMRKTARAWVISREYGYIEIRLQSEGIDIAQARLLRRVDEGAFSALATFTAAELSENPLIYLDTYLEERQGYTYRLEALDASGRSLGFSTDLTL